MKNMVVLNYSIAFERRFLGFWRLLANGMCKAGKRRLHSYQKFDRFFKLFCPCNFAGRFFENSFL